jgi:hypothetical protein
MSKGTASAAPRYSRRIILAAKLSDVCVRCGSTMLYQDFDPQHYHHGITCLACGGEQPLKGDRTSLFDSNVRRPSRTVRRKGVD